MKTITFIVALLFSLQVSSAQQKGFGPHGGRLKTVGNYKIELLGCDNYLELYLYNEDTSAVNNYGIKGNVEFYYSGTATLSSPLTHYGMDGFTAKIPVNTFMYCKPSFDIKSDLMVAEKFENECLKRN